MSMYNFPIRRPVTTVMFMLMIVVVGAVALWKIPLALIPDIEFPNIIVMTGYEGAGPEEIEKRVTKPLEEVIKTVPNIKNVKSASAEGYSIITCEFNWGTNLDEASGDIRSKLELVKEYLPADADAPILLKLSINDMPVAFLSLSGEGRHKYELGKIGKDQVVPRLERIKGVASAQVMGYPEREIVVELDPDKLRAYGVSISDVVNVIRYHNLDLSLGNIKEMNTRFLVKAKGEFESLEELENLVVGFGISPTQRQQTQMAQMMGRFEPLAGKGATNPIRLKDVGKVIDSFAELEGDVRRIDSEGKLHLGVGILVMKESDANMVEVARRVKAELPNIEKDLPKGMNLDLTFDLSEMIEDSINALRRAAYEGAAGAAIVLFIFLLHLAPTLIVVIAIPLSLFVGFICMYFAGYTFNMMTMGAMVIALGKLVDDAIVVLENTVRHLHLGKPPKVAAEEGIREVGIAITAATIVTVIVFLPLAFIQGLSAQLFRSFAATIFFTLMGSLLVAFTIVPMLTSRFLTLPEVKSSKPRRGLWTRIQDQYGKFLEWSLDNRGKILIIAFLFLVLTGVIIAQLPTSFMTNPDMGQYECRVKLPVGTPFEETEKVVVKLEDKIKKAFPDLDRMFEIVGQPSDPKMAAFHGGSQGTHEARIIFILKKKSQGGVNRLPQVRAFFDKVAKDFPSAKITMVGMGLETQLGVDRRPIEIKIFGDDLQVLKKISDDLAMRIGKVDGIRDVKTTMDEGNPEQVMRFDRARLGSYGLVTAQVEMALKTALEGEIASMYREAGDEFNIRVRMQQKNRERIKDLSEVPITTPFGFTLPARALGEFEFQTGPAQVNRENAKRIAKVTADKTDRPLSEIITDINKVLAKYPFPERYIYEFGGEWQDWQETSHDLMLMLLVALLLVYMVLAALYESLIHPFTIMSAVPFAFTGAVIALYITRTPLDVTAFIGLIMLVGIVATNSIVLIDFVIEYARQGMPRREAVVQAGKVRLRPILMTALTTMLGVFPIALAMEEGMEMQQPLGIAIVGGLFSSTFLTLLIIPVLYTIFDDVGEDMKALVRRLSRREKKEQEPAKS